MGTVFLGRNNIRGFRLYAVVSQLFISTIVLVVGGYLLGRYVIFKTAIAGGIMASIGAVIGITYFVWELIKIDHQQKQTR